MFVCSHNLWWSEAIRSKARKSNPIELPIFVHRSNNVFHNDVSIFSTLGTLNGAWRRPLFAWKIVNASGFFTSSLSLVSTYGKLEIFANDLRHKLLKTLTMFLGERHGNKCNPCGSPQHNEYMNVNWDKAIIVLWGHAMVKCTRKVVCPSTVI